MTSKLSELVIWRFRMQEWFLPTKANQINMDDVLNPQSISALKSIQPESWIDWWCSLAINSLTRSIFFKIIDFSLGKNCSLELWPWGIKFDIDRRQKILGEKGYDQHMEQDHWQSIQKYLEDAVAGEILKEIFSGGDVILWRTIRARTEWYQCKKRKSGIVFRI